MQEKTESKPTLKRNLIISGGFMFAMVLSLICPLMYYAADKTVPSLPEHHTYREALGVTLPETVKALAAKAKCSHYVRPIEGIEGDGPAIAGLSTDVNLALQAFDGWQICVNEALKQKMIERANERFKTWGNMGIYREIERQVATEMKVDMNTRYSVKVMCSKLNLGPGDDVKLVLTVNDERTRATLFDVPVTFIAPETLLLLTSARQARLDRIARLRKRAAISGYVFAGVTVAFLSFLLSLSIQYRKVRLKQKNYRNYLVNEIEKREALINDGHFVTALDLADRYLAEFPHDTEIKAFRSRLMDYTNQDPEKAQQAYVEWKKLKSRMANPDSVSAMLLSEDEKQNLSGLLPYHPELKQSVTLMIAQGEQAEKDAHEKALAQLGEVFSLLWEKEKDEALALFDMIRKNHPDLKPAKTLEDRLNNPEPRGFSLTNPRTGSKIEIILRQMAVFGRKDEDPEPDVIFDDRRVSRKHLAIHYDRGAFEVEDLQSAGGTYLNGDEVNRTRLCEGDLLTLAKVIDFDVFIQKNGNNMESGLLLRGADRAVAVVAEFIGLDISAGRVRCPGTMIQIQRHDGMTLIKASGKTLIPGTGDTLTIGEESYHVEVIS